MDNCDSPTIKCVLGVEDGEHPLVEMGEELPQGFLQVDVPALVVRLQFFEEVGEDVAVPLIEDPVRLLEHEVEVALGMSKQLCEEFCKRSNISFLVEKTFFDLISPSNNCAFE